MRGKKYLGLILSCLWVTTRSMFSKLNWIGTCCVSALMFLQKFFGLWTVLWRTQLAVSVAEHLHGLPGWLDCRCFLLGSGWLPGWCMTSLGMISFPEKDAYFVALICLTDLSAGQRSVQNMFDLLSTIYRICLWCSSSLTSFIHDFLTAESWGMSTGESCSGGLKGCCLWFSVAYSCSRTSRRTGYLKCCIPSPGLSWSPLASDFVCRCWLMNKCNWKQAGYSVTLLQGQNRQQGAGRSYSLPATCEDVRWSPWQAFLVCALKQAGDFWGVLWREKRLALSLPLLDLSAAEHPQRKLFISAFTFPRTCAL